MTRLSPREIIWLPSAEIALRDVEMFIANRSELEAARFLERIVSEVDVLESHPFVGRVCAERSDAAIRELIVGNYRVVYRVAEQIVFIMTVFEGHREPPAIVVAPTAKKTSKRNVSTKKR